MHFRPRYMQNRAGFYLAFHNFTCDKEKPPSNNFLRELNFADRLVYFFLGGGDLTYAIFRKLA